MGKFLGLLALLFLTVRCTISLDGDKRILTAVRVTNSTGQPQADVLVESFSHTGTQVEVGDNPFAKIGTAITGADGNASLTSFLKDEGTTEFRFFKPDGNQATSTYYVDNEVFNSNLAFDLGTVVLENIAAVEVKLNNVSMVQTPVPWQVQFSDFMCVQFINRQGNIDTTRSRCNEPFNVALQVPAMETTRSFDFNTLVGSQVVVTFTVNGVSTTETFTVTNTDLLYEINY